MEETPTGQIVFPDQMNVKIKDKIITSASYEEDLALKVAFQLYTYADFEKITNRVDFALKCFERANDFVKAYNVFKDNDNKLKLLKSKGKTKPEIGPTEPPTGAPTEQPTSGPTGTPTEQPTSGPTGTPTEQPTSGPTGTPTEQPTSGPTEQPTSAPSEPPTSTPSEPPTEPPTSAPTEPSTEPPTE